MKTVKHISVLLAVLMVFSLAACFAVSAEEEIPAFEPCITQNGPGLATTLGTITYSAFVSARESETEGKIDYRFLLVADQDSFAEASNAKLVLSFTKGGEVVKSLTKDIMTELDIFAEVSARGKTYIAYDTSLLTGIVISDVPTGAWDEVSATVVDDNGAIATGKVSASSLTIEGLNGTFMPQNHINFYFEVNGNDTVGKKNALVYWFEDKFGGISTVTNVINGDCHANVTINGVKYENIVPRTDVQTGRYLVILLAESGISGFTSGQSYTCSLEITDTLGNLLLYTAEYPVTCVFNA